MRISLLHFVKFHPLHSFPDHLTGEVHLSGPSYDLNSCANCYSSFPLILFNYSYLLWKVYKIKNLKQMLTKRSYHTTALLTLDALHTSAFCFFHYFHCPRKAYRILNLKKVLMIWSKSRLCTVKPNYISSLSLNNHWSQHISIHVYAKWGRVSFCQHQVDMRGKGHHGGW